jgi:hypothetical protein
MHFKLRGHMGMQPFMVEIAWRIDAMQLVEQKKKN